MTGRMGDTETGKRSSASGTGDISGDRGVFAPGSRHLSGLA